MKKLSLTFLLSLICLFVSAQDEHKRIELTEGQKDPVEAEFDFCKLYVYASSTRNGSGINITMEVENNDNTHDLFLFKTPYEEKSLKKQKPPIIFDKYSRGIKNLMTCEGCRGDEILRIEPGRKRTLNFENDDNSKLELPLYIAKNQMKKSGVTKKFIIRSRSIITLDVDVKQEDTTDEEYQKLSTEYEDLLEELSEKTFCPRNSHPTSLSEQEEPYKNKIEDILSEISAIKKEKKWRDRSDDYQDFKKLKEKLENIDFTQYEKWCGKCGSQQRIRGGGGGGGYSRHQCSYCDKSLSDVLRSLQRIYQKLDTGKSKSSVIGEAKALHAAWTRGCPNLSKRKREDTSGKSRQIDTYYNRIEQY